MKMEQTECSEMSAYKLQMPGNYPNESIQHTGTYIELYSSPFQKEHIIHNFRLNKVYRETDRDRNALFNDAVCC
jgi:hypothetical protein